MSHSANPLCFETLLAKTQIKNHKTFYLEDKNIYLLMSVILNIFYSNVFEIFSVGNIKNQPRWIHAFCEMFQT